MFETSYAKQLKQCVFTRSVIQFRHHTTH